MGRTAALAAACAGLVLTIAGCGSSDEEPARPTPLPTHEVLRTLDLGPGAAIDIGVSTALSGAQVALGQDIADAAELAVADFGGAIERHPVNVVRMDDGCTDPEMAVAVARDLIKRPALAGVIGPMCAGGAQAANRIYEDALTVHLSPSSTRSVISEQGERYFFRTAWRDDVQSLVQVLFARDGQAADGAVVVDDGDPYGRGLADSFAEQFEERGGSVLLRERIKRGDTEFSPLVRQVLSAEPDVVVYEGFNPEGALVVRALREAGYTGTFIGPDGLLTGRDFAATAEEHAEGAVLTGGATPDAAFVARFTERFGRPPATPFVLQAYDAMTALLEAIASTATVDGSGRMKLDRERLGETLHEQRIDGLTGSISFDDNGDRAGSTARELGLTVYRIGGGVPVALQ